METQVSKCDMPRCPNADRDVPVEVMNIGDETSLVLRNVCADCADPE